MWLAVDIKEKEMLLKWFPFFFRITSIFVSMLSMLRDEDDGVEEGVEEGGDKGSFELRVVDTIDHP